MAAKDLQYMVSAPRDKDASDPRVASNFHASKEVGEDGKLYMLVSQEDRTKFNVLDDSQLMEEKKRNEELKKTVSSSLMSSTSKLDSHGFPRRVPTPDKPQSPSPRKRTSSPATSAVKPAAAENDRLSRAADALASAIGNSDESVSAATSSDAKLIAAISALQKKYVDNLEMVAKACAEKKEVAERLKSVESQLKHSRRCNEQLKQLKSYHPPARDSASAHDQRSSGCGPTYSASAMTYEPSGGDENIPNGPQSLSGSIDTGPLPPQFSSHSPTRPPPPGTSNSRPLTKSQQELNARPPFCVSPLRPSGFGCGCGCGDGSGKSCEKKPKKTLSQTQLMNLERLNATLEMKRAEERREQERRDALDDEAFYREMEEHAQQEKLRKAQEQKLLDTLRKSTGDVRDWKDIKNEDDEKRSKRTARRRERRAALEAERVALREKEIEASKIPPFKAPDIEKLRESLEKQKTHWDLQHIIEDEKRAARVRSKVLFDRKRRKEQKRIDKDKKRIERARRIEAWKAQVAAKKEKERVEREIKERGEEDLLQRKEVDIYLAQVKEERRREVQAAQEKAQAEKKALEDKLAAREKERRRRERKEKAIDDEKKKALLHQTLHSSVPSSANRFTLTSFARARAVRASIEKRKEEERIQKEEWDRYMGMDTPAVDNPSTVKMNRSNPFMTTDANVMDTQQRASLRASWALNLREYVRKAREANMMPPDNIEELLQQQAAGIGA